MHREQARGGEVGEEVDVVTVVTIDISTSGAKRTFSFVYLDAGVFLYLSRSHVLVYSSFRGHYEHDCLSETVCGLKTPTRLVNRGNGAREMMFGRKR